jgi:hypothetical protein
LFIFELCFSFHRTSKFSVTLKAYPIFNPLVLLFDAFILHTIHVGFSRMDTLRVFYWVLLSWIITNVGLILCWGNSAYSQIVMLFLFIFIMNYSNLGFYFPILTTLCILFLNTADYYPMIRLVFPERNNKHIHYI